MIYPLVIKELREKRYAMAAGVLWVIAPLYFWADYRNIRLPFFLEILFQAAAMVGAAATVLLLSAASFFLERRNGTWHYLHSLPIPRRQLVLVKWAVALGLGILFMSLSSGIAWYPITHIDHHMSGIALLPWICLHAAAVSILMSVLLILDTIDWGEWLGPRAFLTFGFIIGFMVFMEKSNGSFSWLTIALCFGISVALFATAVLFAPILAAEPILLPWQSKERLSSRRFSRDTAWLWLLWRQMRFVVILLLLPVPLLLFVRVLAVASQAASLGELSQLVIGNGKGLPIAGLMCISAAIAGFMMPLVESQSNAVYFRLSLPLPRPRTERLRLVFSIGMLLLIFAPAGFLLSYAAQMRDATVAAGLLGLFCLMICICTIILMASSFAIARSSIIASTLTICLGAAGLVYVTNHLTGSNAPAVSPLFPITIAVVAFAWFALPLIERIREA